MRESRIWVILPLLVVLLAGALGYVLFLERQSAAAETARLEALAEEARPYLEEQERIRDEINQNAGNITASRSKGIALVGYEVSSAGDLETVASHADTYGVRPIVVLNLTDSGLRTSKGVNKMATALNETGFEVAFTANKFDPSDLKKADSIRKKLVNDAKCFLLRSSDDSEYNRSLVAEGGYQVCLRYAEDGSAVIRKDGLICLSCVQVDSSGMDITGRLDKLTASDLTTLFLFSMDDVGEDVIAANLKLIGEYVSDGGVEYRDVKGAVEQVYEDSKSKEERQEAYRVYLDEQMERIAELQRIVRGIYEEA